MALRPTGRSAEVKFYKAGRTVEGTKLKDLERARGLRNIGLIPGTANGLPRTAEVYALIALAPGPKGERLLD